MKKLFLSALAVFSFSFTTVAQQFHWAKAGREYRNVVADNVGNVYLVGYAQYVAIDVDPGPGVSTITPNPTSPMNHPYVVKLNKLGNFVWAYDLNADTYFEDWGLAVDNTQNVYVVGRRNADIFDPGYGGYIRKINSNGTAGWQIELGLVSIMNYSSCTEVAVDSIGDIYVTGTATDPIDMDPGVNNVQHNGGGFIVKYTSAGDYVWHVTGGRDLIKVSSDGNSIYTAEPALPSTFVVNSIRKRDGNGATIWNHTFDSTIIKDININEAGKVYATGYFTDIQDMDPGAGVHELVTAGGTDQFLLKLDSSGVFEWATRTGSTGADEGVGIILDGDGNIYTSGSFTGTVDMDAGTGISNLTTNTPDTSDIFIQKLDIDGDYVWAKPIASFWFDNVLGMTTDTSGSIIFIGNTAADADFDPGTSVFTLPSSSSFVAKWSDTTVLNTPETVLNEKSNITLYPNPSTKTVNISAEQLIENIMVTDVAGRVIYHLAPQRKNASVDILTPGMYFINVTVDDNISRGKVLIQ